MQQACKKQHVEHMVLPDLAGPGLAATCSLVCRGLETKRMGKSMKNWKISTRLAGAFAAMVLLMMVLGGISWVRSGHQRAALNDVVSVRIPITKALAVLDDGVSVQAIQFRNVAIWDTEEIRQRAFTQIASAREAVAAQYKQLDSLVTSPEGKDKLAKMQAGRANFLKVSDQYLALIKEGRRDEALQMLEKQLRPVQLEYQGLIETQLDFQNRITQAAGVRAEEEASALQRDVLIACTVILGLALFLAMAIIRSITAPLSRAVEVADQVAAGDLS
eukprot:gene41933-51972_t